MSQSTTTPQVFISHASEDNDIFVERFAQRLSDKGVGVWFDAWNMQPGDNLVESIYKGIEQATAVIVVLSQKSVQKPWVREEVAASVIRRVYGGIRVIPLLIEECDVPLSLRSYLWVKIKNLEEYEDELNRILRAIYGDVSKPLPSPPERFAPQNTGRIPGLQMEDTQVLRRLCELAVENKIPFVYSHQVEACAAYLGLSTNAMDDVLHVLENRYLIKPHWTMGGALPSLKLTSHGFENYGRHFINGFDKFVNDVLVTLINNPELRGNQGIAAKLDADPTTVAFAMDLLADRGLIRATPEHGGEDIINAWDVTAEGRRKAGEL